MVFVALWFVGFMEVYTPAQSTPPGQPVLQALVTQQNLILTPVHQPSELGLWLNCISSVEITLFPLADILLQHRALFQC